MDRIDRFIENPGKTRVLVVGLARSGVAIAKVLRARGAEVVGTDRKPQVDSGQELEQLGVRLVLGGDHVELARSCDLCVISPGVPLRPSSAPLPAEAFRRGVPVIGELELAHRMLGGRAAPPTIAVTGTNGKSTTTTLCAHLLTQAGYTVFCGGNLGNPLSELLLQPRPVDFLVVEVSSFQLEHLTDPANFVPRIGIWMNVTPDHLDRHVTMRNYARMKRRLFEAQGPAEYGVFYMDDSYVSQNIEGLQCKVAGFSRNPARVTHIGALLIRRELTPNGWDHPFLLGNERLSGDHNAENASAAACMGLLLGMSEPVIQDALDSYQGLPHRIEPVRELGGVRFINDSKGTNLDATAKSLTCFKDGVLLIAGGRGKGTGYSKLRDLVQARVRHLLLLGEEAENLSRDLKGCAKIHMVADMRQAVQIAYELAQPGEVVMLSPACSSFDQFRDYAHRGDVFRELVMGLKEKK